MDYAAYWLTSNKLVNVRYMYVINKMSIPVFQTKYICWSSLKHSNILTKLIKWKFIRG